MSPTATLDRRRTADRARLLEAATTLAFDPVAFSRSVLGVDPWRVPEQILSDVAHPRARVAVKACHASSKTHTSAQLVLWWAWRGGLAVTTAPTWTQVEDVLWTEIHKLYQNARFPLGGELLRTEYRGPTGGVAMGISTDQGVRFQGFHGRVLLVLDEATGIRPDIFEAAEGIAAGGDVRFLYLGNPTASGTPFAALFEGSAPGVTLHTINAFDTPNLQGLDLTALLALPDHELDQNVRPYLVTRRWVRDRYLEWGEDSPLWQSRVLGEFPDQGEDALIARSLVALALRRTLDVPPATPFCAGLDVAGPGDDETALAIRQGGRVVAQHAWHEGDTGRLIGSIRQALEPYADHLGAFCVDATGIGWHLAGALKSLLPSLPVVPVNVGARSSAPHRFANLKAELYWLLREFFVQEAIAGPFDATTQAQLASLRWHTNLRGLIEIEHKDQLRARGVPSPDRAEALVLAFASHALTPPPKAGVRFGSGRGKTDLTQQFIRLGG